MSDINHFTLSSILGSEIVGRVEFGHGQIGSLGDVQRYFELLRTTKSPTNIHENEEVDPQRVVKAFHEIRSARADQGSADLYIADPERNAAFLAQCRKAGIQASDYTINKTLLRERKRGRLKGLQSVKTSFDYEDYAFASEFAATELKYLCGASVDDILCDPALASRFDSIASNLAPGFPSLRYRWEILRIRKRGKRGVWNPEWPEPQLTGQFRLVHDCLDAIPNEQGVYLLYESGKQKSLFARSTKQLRHAVEIHRRPRLMSAISDQLWKPDLDNLVISYALLPAENMLKPAEKRIIMEKKPVFNVPRAA